MSDGRGAGGRMPSISVIITAYNNRGHIPDAIASVRSQTVLPDEIVVIDDGSTDDTKAILDTLGADIAYHRQANGGEAVARNSGIANSRCDLLAFLDADDAWPPGRNALLLEGFARTPSLEIVCGRARTFAGEEWTAALTPAPHRLEAVVMSFGAALIRRSVFERIGGLDPAIGLTTDFDWFMRCREQSVATAIVDDVTLLYRRHFGTLSRNVAGARAGLSRTIKLSLDRRRSAGDAKPLPRWESLGRES